MTVVLQPAVNASSVNTSLAPIVCIDSGVGGLHVFKHLSSLIPLPLPLVYIADYAGFPYGEKHPDTLRTRLIALIEYLHLSIKPSLIVLACNTATTVAIETLRTVFPEHEFVGCVPAIKPAARATQQGTIALLATPATCKQSYVDKLIQQTAQDCTVLRFPLRELANLAERYFFNKDSLSEAQLHQALSPLLQHPDVQSIDQIILGCTHYRFLLSPMQKLGYSHWNWVDSSEAVALQALRIWQKQTEHCTPSSPLSAAPSLQFFYTVEVGNEESAPPCPVQLQNALTQFGFDPLQPLPWRWLKHRLRLSDSLAC